MSKISMSDTYNVDHIQDDKKHMGKGCVGVIEFTIRDKNGQIIDQFFEKNIVKIFAKEMLAHRLPSSEIWDPTANGGAGGWVSTNIDPTDEYSARYILFGASFDVNGSPIENDPRYYQLDSAKGTYIPRRLGPGAEFHGELINAIPFSEPDRPLKRVEKISFDPTYQPAGLPLLQDDVRAMNNIVALETTLQLNEYNGSGSGSDFFVITEVALAGGKKIDSVGQCECPPRKLFLDGPVKCMANGSDVVNIISTETQVDLIKEGDQLEITGPGAQGTGDDIRLQQVSPFYMVLQKQIGGRDIQLDRVPVDSSNHPIIGPINVYRNTLKIFSHRLLKVPFRKSCDISIGVKWRIIFS